MEDLANHYVIILPEFTRDLYPRSFNYNGDKDRVPVHSENTCKWFLDHPNFVQWQQSTEASALWVTADAGCGKSVLARFLIGHLADGHKVIYFFFQHSRYGINDMLRALLHQILVVTLESSEAKSSAVLRLLCDELMYKMGEQVMNEDEKLWNIICHATTGGGLNSSKLFCVIDGLDECEEKSRLQFIKFIVSTFSNSDTPRQPHQPPNFLITSRPYVEIEENFHPLAHIRLRLEEKTSEISKDIEMMIIDRIQNLNSKRFPPESQKYLHAEISLKAGRTFLWVKLIFDALEQLDSTTRKEICKLICTNPSELNTLYESSLSTENKERTRRLLQILIAATRPLNLDEVNVALQISEDCVRFEDIELEPDVEGTIKRLCGSVIRITDSTVDFMHQTAREFLTTSRIALEPPQNLTWRASIDHYQAHCNLGSICLRYLALTDWNERPVRWTGERFDIGYCGNDPQEWARRHGRLHTTIRNSSQSEDNYPKDSAPYTHEEFDKIRAEVNKISCFYQYAGRNWPHHSEEALRWLRRARELGFEPDRDFCKLQALLTSLRKSSIGRIRRCTSTSDDPFRFLEEEGFQFLFDRLSNGPRIKGYTDRCIIETLIHRLQSGKKLFWKSSLPKELLFEYLGAKDSAILRFRDVKKILQEMISSYRFNQKDQAVKQTETLEFFLRRLFSNRFRAYYFTVIQAIRWRHPVVDYLIRSPEKFPLIRKRLNDSYDEVQHASFLHEIFSAACRYGSPTASLLFECSNATTGLAIDVNRADMFGVTPLIAAILANDYSLCEWLLRKKSNVNFYVSYRSQVNFREGTFTKAPHILSGGVARFESPLSRHWNWIDCHPNIPKVSQRYGNRNFNSSPLAEALRMRNLRIFRLVLEYGGDPWQDYGSSVSVLEAAALHSEGFFDQVVGLIRTKGVGVFDINSPEAHSKRTLLHIAAKSGFWNSVIELIRNGSSVDVEDATGRTPLHEIALFSPTDGRLELFEKLVVDHRASANMTNDKMETPLDILEKSISNSNTKPQNQYHIETCLFLEKLRTEPTYLPWVNRTLSMRLDGLLRDNTDKPVASSPAAEFDYHKYHDELELGSGCGSDVTSDIESNSHRETREHSDVDDGVDPESESDSGVFQDVMSGIDSFKSGECPDAGVGMDLGSDSDSDVFHDAMSAISESDESQDAADHLGSGEPAAQNTRAFRQCDLDGLFFTCLI